MKRFFLAFFFLVLVGAACAGIVWFNIFRDNAIQQFFANMPVAPSAVSTIEVEPVSWTPGIEAIGTVAASQGVDLTVETAGVVKEILFQSNQKVEQGAVLVQLDDSVQRADLAAAETQASLDQQQLQRAEELQKKGVGSASTLDQARAAAQASAAQVQKLQAVLDQRQLRAPFTGTIGLPRIDVGQYLSPSQTVATLQDLETMRADFSVPEQQLAELKIGQPVRFGTSQTELGFDGTVTGIDPKVDPSSRLVAIRAEITNPDGKLSPGQYIRVRVELPREDGIIALPQTAVVTSLYGDFVFLVRPKGAEKSADKPAAATEPPTASDAAGAANAAPAAEADNPAEPAKPAEAAADAKPADAPAAAAPAGDLVAAQVFVKLGRRNLDRVEVLEGVKAGDIVVTAGQNRLSNGTPVVINNSVDPAKGPAAGGATP